MSISEEIKDVVTAQLAEDEFLVDVILKGAPGTHKLIVLVDSDTGMSIEGCSRISRLVSRYLDDHDRFESAYTIEVSTPGLDHPLKLWRQYTKNIGRNLRIETVDNQEIEGVLTGMKNENVLIIEMETGKGKKKDKHSVQVPFTSIQKAMVLVSFSKQG